MADLRGTRTRPTLLLPSDAGDTLLCGCLQWRDRREPPCQGSSTGRGRKREWASTRLPWTHPLRRSGGVCRGGPARCPRHHSPGERDRGESRPAPPGGVPRDSRVNGGRNRARERTGNGAQEDCLRRSGRLPTHRLRRHRLPAQREQRVDARLHRGSRRPAADERRDAGRDLRPRLAGLGGRYRGRRSDHLGRWLHRGRLRPGRRSRWHAHGERPQRAHDLVVGGHRLAPSRRPTPKSTSSTVN